MFIPTVIRFENMLDVKQYFQVYEITEIEKTIAGKELLDYLNLTTFKDMERFQEKQLITKLNKDFNEELVEEYKSIFMEEILEEEEKEREKAQIKRDDNKLKKIADKKNEPYKRKVDTNDLELLKFHLSQIHHNMSKTTHVTISFKNKYTGLLRSWGFSLKDLENEDLLKRLLVLGQDHDVYISQNNFRSYKRSIADCASSSCFIIDLDYYQIPEFNEMSADWFVGLMEFEGMFKSIAPSYIIQSGRGLSLVFLTDLLLLSNSKIAYLRERIVKALYFKYKKWGADAKALDLARINRIPGAINSKSDTKASVMLIDPAKPHESCNMDEFKALTFKRYSLDELIHTLLPARKIKKEADIVAVEKNPVKKVKSPIKEVFSLKSLDYHRAKDLEILLKMRGRIDEGCRNNYLHLYIYFLVRQTRNSEPIYTEDQLHSLAFKANQKVGVSQSELNLIIRNAIKNQSKYNYSNAKIIEWLEITPEEEAELKTIISKTEKNKRKSVARKEAIRNEKGLTNREQAYEERLNAIETAMKLGHDKKATSEILNISQKTVSRFMKEIESRKINQRSVV